MAFQNLKKIGTIVLISLFILCPKTSAQTSCESDLTKAKEALTNCINLIFEAQDLLKAKTEIISDQEKVINDLTKHQAELQAALDKRNAWYYNPLIIGVIGISAGVIGGVWLVK